MNVLRLADLGEGMHEAEVVEWLVKEGDTVKIDQTVVKVETDKAIVEIPSPVTGRVTEIRVSNGETAKVGDVLVVFDAPDVAKSDNGMPVKQDGLATTAQQPTVISPAVSIPQSPKHRVLAAPAVRKIAFELGVDLEQVTPTLSGGRVSLDDVKAFAARLTSGSPTTTSFVTPYASDVLATESVGAQFIAPTLTPALEDERQPLTGLRKRIAEHMERSWRTIPHATAFGELDGSALIALRESLKVAAEQRGAHLTYMPLLIKLLIPVLKEFPLFNASLDEEKREIIYRRSYHIGVATATPEGLLVPVLRNADRLTLVEIANTVEQLIEGAKKRTMALPEVSGSTFTLNNVGSFGGSTGTPIINHPEVAILAVGRLQEQAVVRQGTIVARPIMPLALSFDHRLIDGALAGAFLARFKELVENPQQIMLDMV